MWRPAANYTTLIIRSLTHGYMTKTYYSQKPITIFLISRGIICLIAMLIIQTHSYGYGEYLLQSDLD